MKNIYLLFLIIPLVFSCQNTTTSDNNIARLTRGTVNIIDESAEKFVSSDSKIELLADSLTIAEGPLWLSKSNSLIFTQVQLNKVYRWSEEDGLSLYMDPSGYTGIVPVEEDGILGSNGMTLNSDGELILMGNFL